jgi:hypothetical protein
MLLEIIITLEVIAFIFLALGIIPFKSDNKSMTPLINKIVFLIVSAIVFFSVAMTSASYDYASCYINQTIITGPNLHSSVDCVFFTVEGDDLSYINWGFGILAVLLAIVIVLMVVFSTKHRRNEGED